MTGIPFVASYFQASAEISGGVRIYFRKCAEPAPFSITLVNLPDLEAKIGSPEQVKLLLAHLSPEEKEIYAGYTFPKRKREWLGGRLAAKYSILSLLEQTPPASQLSDIVVLPQENGSPGITGPHFSPGNIPALSISHSGDFAVALAADAGSCGIDIQKISSSTERVADRFCSEEETALLQKHLPQLSQIQRLTMLWSAKEALKKALLSNQPFIFQGVVLRDVEPGEQYTLHLEYPGVLDRPKTITVIMFGNYMLAYTLAGSRHA